MNSPKYNFVAPEQISVKTTPLMTHVKVIHAVHCLYH